MNKRRRYLGKRLRAWAEAFKIIDGFKMHGLKACSVDARRLAINYLNAHRPQGTTRRRT